MTTAAAIAAPVLIAAGGTGGHMFPALALARELRRRGRPVELVVDARGLRWVDKDLPVHLVTAGSPSGSVVQKVRGVLKLVRGAVECIALVRRLRPVAAACFGGYASFPAALAARLAGRPTLLHEQNAVLGRANRLAGRFADKVALSFERTDAAETVRDRAFVTGNPVRDGFATDAAAYAPPSADETLRILVMGGSQGARILSDVVPAAFAAMEPAQRRRFALTQQCRPEDLERVRAAYAGIGTTPELASFFTDAAERMAHAHLVLTRSGASTVAEILVLGRPSLLVPYRFAADDHQRANAERLQSAGAAISITETELTPERLATELTRLREEPGRLAAMAANALALARPDAAARLADAVIALADGPTSGDGGNV